MSRTRVILPIEGMSCASCAATVQEALGSAGGVANATVNYAAARAAVDYDDAHTNVAELIKTVRTAGYDCGNASVTFAVEQLHYAPSVAPLEQGLIRVPGVIRAAANQATETVTVDYVPGATTADALERAVEQAGFRVADPMVADAVDRISILAHQLGKGLPGEAIRLFALAAPLATAGVRRQILHGLAELHARTGAYSEAIAAARELLADAPAGERMQSFVLAHQRDPQIPRRRVEQPVDGIAREGVAERTRPGSGRRTQARCEPRRQVESDSRAPAGLTAP